MGTSGLYKARLDPRVNVEEVLSTFEAVPYVNSASPNRIIGEGDSIRLETAGAGYALSFSTGWGDCPAGCISGHSWTFRFTEDLEIEAVEEGGDPLEEERPAGPLRESLPGRRPPRGGVETRN